ncbi:HNH endonuclease [Nocardia sp. NPDC055321]
MSVSRRLRFEILRRDDHRCRYCGAAAPEVNLTVDHVVPTALGGRDDPTNLVTACADCNSGKTSIAPDSAIVVDVSADAVRWAAALQQAANERAQQFADSKKTADQFRALWEQWTWTDRSGEKHPFGLPGDFASSVRQFLSAGLTFTDLDELIDVAMNANGPRDDNALWKYFCGCCWKRLAQAQERATQLLSAPVEPAAPSPSNLADSERRSVESRWWISSEDWHAATGRVLPECECCLPDSRFCGRYTCKAAIAAFAEGALHDLDWAFEAMAQLRNYALAELEIQSAHDGEDR